MATGLGGAVLSYRRGRHFAPRMRSPDWGVGGRGSGQLPVSGDTLLVARRPRKVLRARDRHDTDCGDRALPRRILPAAEPPAIASSALAKPFDAPPTLRVATIARPQDRPITPSATARVPATAARSSTAPRVGAWRSRQIPRAPYRDSSLRTASARCR